MWAELGMAALNAIAGYESDRSQASASRKASEREYLRQKEFAQHGIQWKVADAKSAGIHPLYALGGAGPTYSPAIALDGGGRGASAIAQAGQDISRARMANMDRNQRAKEVARASVDASRARKIEDAQVALGLERGALENEVLRSQLARLNSAQLGPPMSMGGSASAGRGGDRVVPLPAQPVINAPNQHGREAGNITDYAFSRTHRGGLVPVPSQDVKNRIEDSPMEWAWFWRNNVLPNFDQMPAPRLDEFPLPPGQRWEWNRVEQQFLPRDARGTWHVRAR